MTSVSITVNPRYSRFRYSRIRLCDDPFCDHLFARRGIPRLFATEIQENNFKMGYLACIWIKMNKGDTSIQNDETQFNWY